MDLGHLPPYPWVFRVADVPFGIIGCDCLTFLSFQVDVKNKRLSEPERSEFNPPHKNTSSRADSATAGFEHCSQSFISHSAVTEQNKTDLSPPEGRFNVKLKSTNTNIGETNSELKSQLLNREASSAFATQQSTIKPSIKHRPTPLSLNKEQNTVQTKQVSVETQTEWQPLDFQILPAEPQPSEQAGKTAKPTVEAFAVVHSLNDKTKTPPTLTDATKVNQIPVNEMKTAVPKRDAPALQNTLINDNAKVFQKTIQKTNFKHNINHHIITSGPPVKSDLRQLSPEKLTFVKEEIAQLLKDGIITPSSSPYASPIHIVPKSQPGKFRMVGDYWALNTTTQPDCYPLPFLNDFADMLHGCTVFSKLDCYKGYHQTRLLQRLSPNINDRRRRL